MANNTSNNPVLWICVLLVFLVISYAAIANEEIYPLRWVYCGVNFQVSDSVDRLIEVMKKAKGIGYNGVVVTDYKFGRIEGRSEVYFHNLNRAKQVSDKLDIEIIPVIMSPSVLINDPNMVEGIPVKDCRFVVKDDKAVVKNKENFLPGGDFERTADDDSFEGWDWIDGPGNSSFMDTEVKYWGAVFPCLLNEDLFTYYREQILDLNRYFSPQKYFMAHDELRVAGWCETCSKAGTVGKSLAQHIKRCTELIRSINPDADILVWSDMFDPYHNAKSHPYYLCATSFDGSWEGLDSSVIIVNWNSGKRDSSMPFFAQRGHRQIIAGYYDSPEVEARLVDWLNAADKVDGVIGVMYTTWQSNYGHMEIFHESLNDYILGR